MIKSKTLIIGLIILVAIILFGSYMLLTWKSQTSVPSSNNGTETAMPKATGNVDDLVEASIQGVLDENSFYDEEDSDIDLLLSDTKEINAFGQMTNEDEF